MRKAYKENLKKKSEYKWWQNGLDGYSTRLERFILNDHSKRCNILEDTPNESSAMQTIANAARFERCTNRTDTTHDLWSLYPLFG